MVGPYCLGVGGGTVTQSRGGLGSMEGRKDKAEFSCSCYLFKVEECQQLSTSWRLEAGRLTSEWSPGSAGVRSQQGQEPRWLWACP